MKPISRYRIVARFKRLIDVFCRVALTVGIVFAGTVHAKKPQIGAASSLHIIVENIVGVEGPIMLQVLAGEAGFKGEVGPVASLVLPAQRGSIGVHLDGFPPGDYAIRVMHDVDGDGELKTNMLGIPTEPWGMSNNASGAFGPPSWQDARFTVASQALQTITLRQ